MAFSIKCITFPIFLLLLSPMMAYSTTDSEALLSFKDSLTNTDQLNSSWIPNTSPCDEHKRWHGIICSGGNVTGIRLEEMQLSGNISIAPLISLSNIRAISITGNNLSGPIPKLNLLSSLKAIFLSRNNFSGEIPSDFFAEMQSLKKLWLSDNKFSGQIPSSLGHLSQLIQMHLENNEFNGTIPPMELGKLEYVNFSDNKLEGEVPKSLLKFNKSSFSGNDYLCSKELGLDCKTPVQDGTEQNDRIGIAIMIIGVVLLVFMVLAIVLIKMRENKEKQFNLLGSKDARDEIPRTMSSIKDPSSRRSQTSMRNSSSRKSSTGASGSARLADLIMVNDRKGEFGLADLMKAAAEVLGNGGLGSSYKAVLSSGVVVVVKRMRELNRVGKDGFAAEMKRIGKFKHQNIMTPLAFHYRRDEKLVVYEFIPKGSLLYLLHGDRASSQPVLDWQIRLKIIKGIARGLEYISKEYVGSELYHGNLKSSNIFLNSNFEPLISEFGFSKIINPSKVSQALFASRAPEAAQFGQYSPKCDVYSLGIVILEVLTGKFPSQYHHNNGKGGTDVVEWVNSAIAGGRELEFLDPELATGSSYALAEMGKLLHIAAACTERIPETRLSLEEAVRRIEEIISEPRGGQEGGKTYHLLPSLRDGYADASASAAQANVQSSNAEHSELPGKVNNSDERSLHNSGGSFAF